ncbi:glycosyltransferase family 92 protein [Desulfovibrio sp. TomC]|uniref:glycosyltransferase family 92 protein n=1 Tax=Desulfovibrio sp. TomC TaxID=1562888 RepID=UPI0005733F30|nr:glycosyltransferase family 92 protein [Desulfovibrio sp. TomC]KHK00204.1 hypothetical protein NY78_4387 [Desulfovibrio sp. TomC]
MNYIGVCAIARDEDRDLEEWIQYHAMIGVERFIIYDNESSNPIRDTLHRYTGNGFVTVIDAPGPFPQYESYQHCLDNFGHCFRWMAFIDVDEFIVLKQNKYIHSLLLEYEEFGGLVMNWVMFGSNGFIKRPQGLALEHFVARFDYGDRSSQTIKSIVQPRYVEHANLTAHHFTYIDGKYAVNEMKIPAYGNQSPFSGSKIQLNHYRHKSQEDFQKKIPTWCLSHLPASEESIWSGFYEQAYKSTVVDDGMKKHSLFIKKLSRKYQVFIDMATRGACKLEFHEFIEECSKETEKEDHEEALRLMARCGLYYNDYPDYHLQKSYIYLATGKIEQAFQCVDHVLRNNFVLEAYIALYYILVARGDTIAADGIVNYLDLMTLKHKEQNVEYDVSIDAFVESHKKGTRF